MIQPTPMVARPDKRIKGELVAALAILLSPMLSLALAWLLVWITNAFGGTPESLGLRNLFGFLAVFGALGWVVTVPLAIVIALAALVRNARRAKDVAER